MSLSTHFHMCYEGPEHQMMVHTHTCGKGLVCCTVCRVAGRGTSPDVHPCMLQPAHPLLTHSAPIGMMPWGCAAHTMLRSQAWTHTFMLPGKCKVVIFVTVQLSCTACTLPRSLGWTHTSMQPEMHKNSHVNLTGRVPLGCTACTMSRRAWSGLARAPWDQSKLKLPELLETRPFTLQVKLRSRSSSCNGSTSCMGLSCCMLPRPSGMAACWGQMQSRGACFCWGAAGLTAAAPACSLTLECLRLCTTPSLNAPRLPCS